MSAEPEGGWRQHMPFDAEQRRAKAQKIIAILLAERSLRGTDILEIGTGTGVIPAELGKIAGPDGRVVSIDTMDTRIDTNGYEFALTRGVELPFDDATFDVVVSNHVVEHVGDRAVQQKHLSEIGRVLRPGGVGYIATPNRWALIEPHFRVPLLSWLPRRVRTAYLRLTRRGHNYDVDPYGPRQIRAAFTRVPLEWSDRSLNAVDELVRLEAPSRAIRLAAKVPPRARRFGLFVAPTMIYVVRPPR
jgi:SAM-dependent methyltransferase